MKILIIEDDKEMAYFIKTGLCEDSFSVEIVNDGSGGSFLARTNIYDVIVMDYSLPIKNGMEICEEIRNSGITTPIIFLTMHNEIKKKIQALNIGADDYMVKPFSLEELKARIKALSRRPKKIEDTILYIDDIVIDTLKKLISRGGIQIYLTRKTYNLLEYLVKNRGVILSRGMIMEYVWNSESDPFSNTVEAHILNLRKKINAGGKKDILRNIPGRGYIID